MTSMTHPANQRPENLLDLPPMSLGARIKAAVTLAWRTLRTGRNLEADFLADGMRIGMDGGFAAALGEYNAALVSQGIDPIRGAR